MPRLPEENRRSCERPAGCARSSQALDHDGRRDGPGRLKPSAKNIARLPEIRQAEKRAAVIEVRTESTIIRCSSARRASAGTIFLATV